MLLHDAVEAYLRARRTRVAVNTWRSDEVTLRRLPRILGDPEVEEVDPDVLDAFWESQVEAGLASSSLNLMLGKVQQFFAWCQARGLIAANPAVDRRRFRQTEPVPLHIPVTDFPRLLQAAAGPRDRMIIALGLYTFLRASEIQSLRMKDWDPAGWLAVTLHKTAQRDTMPICAELSEEIMRWITWYETRADLTPESFFVPQVRALRVWPEAYPGYGQFKVLPAPRWIVHPDKPTASPHRSVKAALAACGYPTERQGCHTLRRSGARALFDSLRGPDGIDGALQQTRVMLHHASSTQTERYLGVAPEREIRNLRLRGRPMFEYRESSGNHGMVGLDGTGTED